MWRNKSFQIFEWCIDCISNDILSFSLDIFRIKKQTSRRFDEGLLILKIMTENSIKWLWIIDNSLLIFLFCEESILKFINFMRKKCIFRIIILSFLWVINNNRWVCQDILLNMMKSGCSFIYFIVFLFDEDLMFHFIYICIIF